MKPSSFQDIDTLRSLTTRIFQAATPPKKVAQLSRFEQAILADINWNLLQPLVESPFLKTRARLKSHEEIIGTASTKQSASILLRNKKKEAYAAHIERVMTSLAAIKYGLKHKKINAVEAVDNFAQVEADLRLISHNLVYYIHEAAQEIDPSGRKTKVKAASKYSQILTDFSQLDTLLDSLKNLKQIKMPDAPQQTKPENGGSSSGDMGVSTNLGTGEDEGLPNDPYASPSNYPKYMKKFTENAEEVLRKAQKEIKQPKLSDEKPWGIVQMPVMLFTTPMLSETKLLRNGVRVQSVPPMKILYGQKVLAILSKFRNETEKAHSGNKEITETLPERAQRIIKTSLTGQEVTFSQPFSAKLNGVSYVFYWIIPSQLFVQMGHFKINSIGLPLAAGLKKAEDLTGDIEQIRREGEQQNKRLQEKVEEKRKAFEPIAKMRDTLIKKLGDIKDRLVWMRKNVKELVEEINQYDIAARNTKGTSAYSENVLRKESAEFKLKKVQQEIDHLVKIERPFLQEQLDLVQQQYRKFMAKWEGK